MSFSSAFFNTVAINGATPVVLQAAPGAGKALYVTKVTISITTHANAKFVEVKDGASLVIGKVADLTAAAGVPSVVTFDFGKGGVKLGENQALDVLSEGSGPAGIVYAEGYTSTI